MPTRQDAQTHAGQHLVMPFFLATTWSPGPPSDSKRYPAPAPRLNIELLLMLSPSPAGFANSAPSYTTHRSLPPSSTVTTCQRCTSPPTLFSINVQNMWRSISILFGIAWPSATSASSMFHRHLSTLISSKGLPSTLFLNFRSSLNVRHAPG